MIFHSICSSDTCLLDHSGDIIHILIKTLVAEIKFFDFCGHYKSLTFVGNIIFRLLWEIQIFRLLWEIQIFRLLWEIFTRVSKLSYISIFCGESKHFDFCGEFKHFDFLWGISTFRL